MKRRDFIKEATSKSVDELRDQARSMKEELLKLRFRQSTGQLEQGHRIGEVKKNLARVNTIIRQKQAEA